MSQRGNTKQLRDVVCIESDERSSDIIARGYIWNGDDGDCYWVDEGALDPLMVDLSNNVRTGVKRADDPVAFLEEHISGIGKFGNNRAPVFIRRLQHDFGTLSVDGKLVARDNLEPHNELIPVGFTVSKTIMYAYFAAHGFDNDEIAELFGVSESTVRVNLSKFKNE
jgi:hypothetical protein